MPVADKPSKRSRQRKADETSEAHAGKVEAKKNKGKPEKTQAQLAANKADETCADAKKRQGLTDAFNCLLDLAKENASFKIPASFSPDVAQSRSHF